MLTIIIPAYNEAESIPFVLPSVLEFCRDRKWSTILINDGSTDDTKNVLLKFSECENLTVIHHKVNRGYGGAIKTGINYSKTKYCVTFDSDGQHDINDVENLLKHIVATNADLIVGNRINNIQSGWYRELGKNFIKNITRLMMTLNIKDLNSGMKIYNTKLAQNYIRICPDSMAFSDIITLIFIYEKNLVLEIPINLKKRIAGMSTISIRTAFETILEILNIVTLFNPMRIFLPLSIASIVISILWEIPIFLKGNGISTGALLGFVTGILIFILGLVAEQLGSIRRLIIGAYK